MRRSIELAVFLSIGCSAYLLTRDAHPQVAADQSSAAAVRENSVEAKARAVTGPSTSADSSPKGDEEAKPKDSGSHADNGVVNSVSGWRGNWLGLFPEATPPLTWSRKCNSPVGDLICSAHKPKDAESAGKPVIGGMIPEWLTLVGISAPEGDKAIDSETIKGEAALSPDEGNTEQTIAWTLLAPKLNHQTIPESVLNLQPASATDNRASYAHTYLYSPVAGKIAFALTHDCPLELFVNGKKEYKSSSLVRASMPSSGQVHDLIVPKESPAIAVAAVEKGWNRVLVKLAAHNSHSMKFGLCVTAPPDATYESKNIIWECKLPSWGWSTPVIRGNKIFLTSELDELVCVDKTSGKILWERFNTTYDATTETERAANPAFKNITALREQLDHAKTYEEKIDLERQINALLQDIDKVRFPKCAPGQMIYHGFASATPCCDDEHVYVVFCHGVAACYDFNGNRTWIQLSNDVNSGGTYNIGSPALIGDAFIILRNSCRAFDKKTGKILWTTPSKKGERSSGVTPARINGVDLAIGQFGQIIRVSDGAVLSKTETSNHHSVPIQIGEYWYEQEDSRLLRWKPKCFSADYIDRTEQTSSESFKNWLEGWSISAPIYHKELFYCLEMYGQLAVLESLPNKLEIVYKKQLPVHPLYTDRDCGCVASPILGGNHIFLSDNDGTTVAIEPGREYKQAALNKIENFLPRNGIYPAQERFNSSLICDGKYLYARGEDRLYCLGEK
jgi:outer membrane protein assembly factor BamB